MSSKAAAHDEQWHKCFIYIVSFVCHACATLFLLTFCFTVFFSAMLALCLGNKVINVMYQVVRLGRFKLKQQLAKAVKAVKAVD